MRSQSVASGGQCARPGEDARVLRQGRQQCAGGTAGADQARAARIDSREDLAVGVETEDASLPKDDRVDGVAVRLVACCDDRLLVRDGHVRPVEAECLQRTDRRNGIGDIESGVVPVEPADVERSILHPRRERVSDRASEESDLVQQPYP